MTCAGGLGRRPGSFRFPPNLAGVQVTNRRVYGGQNRGNRLRGRSNSDSRPAPFYHLLDGITLFGIKAAQLIFHVEAGLAAQVEQVFALHVQFARQGVDTDFLSLQAELLC